MVLRCFEDGLRFDKVWYVWFLSLIEGQGMRKTPEIGFDDLCPMSSPKVGHISRCAQIPGALSIWGPDWLAEEHASCRPLWKPLDPLGMAGMAAWHGPGLPSQRPLRAAGPPSQQPQAAATGPKVCYKNMPIYRWIVHYKPSSWGETPIFIEGHWWIMKDIIHHHLYHLYLIRTLAGHWREHQHASALHPRCNRLPPLALADIHERWGFQRRALFLLEILHWLDLNLQSKTDLNRRHIKKPDHPSNFITQGNLIELT